MSETISPAELAKRYSVKVDKIHQFIRSGELVAINVASSLSGRPRWRIPLDTLEAFENRRLSKSPVKPPHRRSAPKPLVEYV